jgi:hypothetical protein
MNRRVSDEQLIEAIITHQTNEQAAAAVGLSVRTLYERKSDEAFRARLQEAREMQLRAAVDELSRAALSAVLELEAIATNPANPAGVRVQAAQGLLAYAFKK